MQFQSTRPVRGATAVAAVCHLPEAISIHAPRAGRDLDFNPAATSLSNFNPRAPCGARRAALMLFLSISEFQSTRPVRGATAPAKRRPPSTSDFNPRAPCGARRGGDRRGHGQRNFNPRAPCGARPLRHPESVCAFGFQSTRPVRGATSYPQCWAVLHNHFNPRAPCGARQLGLLDLNSQLKIFQSTRPVRGATVQHLLRVISVWRHFNPRAPCGARRDDADRVVVLVQFQSTRPVRGATRALHGVLRAVNISIHAPRAGRDSKSIQNYFTHFCDKRQFLDNFTQNAAF